MILNFGFPTPRKKKVKKILLNRFSKKIGEILWYPNLENVIFTLDNSIQAIELDGRNVRNTTTLTQFDTINNLMIDNKGEKIYFKGSIGNKEGVFELNIH